MMEGDTGIETGSEEAVANDKEGKIEADMARREALNVEVSLGENESGKEEKLGLEGSEGVGQEFTFALADEVSVGELSTEGEAVKVEVSLGENENVGEKEITSALTDEVTVGELSSEGEAVNVGLSLTEDDNVKEGEGLSLTEGENVKEGETVPSEGLSLSDIKFEEDNVELSLNEGLPEGETVDEELGEGETVDEELGEGVTVNEELGEGVTVDEELGSEEGSGPVKLKLTNAEPRFPNAFAKYSEFTAKEDSNIGVK